MATIDLSNGINEARHIIEESGIDYSTNRDHLRYAASAPRRHQLERITAEKFKQAAL